MGIQLTNWLTTTCCNNKVIVESIQIHGVVLIKLWKGKRYQAWGCEYIYSPMDNTITLPPCVVLYLFTSC